MSRLSAGFVWAMVLLSSAPAFSSGYVEERNVVKSGNAPLVAVSFADSLRDPIGWYAWSQVGSSYAQAYVGPTVAPKKWFQVGAALGLEQAQRTGRFGSFVWLGAGRCSILGVYEDGGSGSFRKAVGRCQLGPTHVGLWYDNYLGAGPYLEASVPKTPLTLWGTVCQNATQVAVRMTF